MYSRERAEQVIINAMRAVLNIGFKPFTLGNAHVGINAQKGRFSAGLRRDAPLTINMFDEGALKTAQLDMLQELFRRYDVEYSSAEAKAMLSALVGSSLARYVKAFAKSLPVIGNLLDDDAYSLPVLAAAVTYALGQVTVLRLEMEQPFISLNLNAVFRHASESFGKTRGIARKIRTSCHLTGRGNLD